VPISGTFAVAASAEDVVDLSWIHVLSGSLPATLVAVEPLKRRVAETDRAGRGALGGRAPSLLRFKPLALLMLFDEELAFVVRSWEVKPGGESKGALAFGGTDEVVTGVLSVAVVGGPNAGPAGDLCGL
jgi:hypothetical protein